MISNYTVYLLVITIGSTAAWLIKARAPDPLRASFECGVLLGLAVCLSTVALVDLVQWYNRRRALRDRYLGR